ncbi:nickel/cobalt efflux transporter [Stella sp.]|uniref:nickel/cobalt efflux transporter n=1 Tax=Stella sp. TaxID=2912054 RepID=UPI0035B20416
MSGFAELIRQGSLQAWLFVPSAILLGALHGLEPGHSKTMMAAFIVAIRGTVRQAAMLGIAATVSHTLVVWVIALGGLYLWRDVQAETFEPYFQLASAAIIIAIALWMFWRVWQDRARAELADPPDGHGTTDGHAHHGHAHQVHGHDHHGHGAATRRIDTGHGVIAVEIFEDDGRPRWRIRSESGRPWPADDVAIVTERPSADRQAFALVARGDCLESVDPIPEPHEFMARISLGHGNHTHDYDLSFVAADSPAHDHLHEEVRGLRIATDGYQDAHELAHANDIRRRFADRAVTNWQIVLFGLTGGLIPCPAAITVLVLCLQLRELTVGFALVLCFSIGLALTLVAVGAAAALSVRGAARRWTWFGTLARRAPYLSALLMIAVGLYVGFHGWSGLAAIAGAPAPA